METPTNDQVKSKPKNKLIWALEMAKVILLISSILVPQVKQVRVKLSIMQSMK